MTLRVDKLTPAQAEVAAELLSIAAGLHCYEDAVLIIERLHALRASGQQSSTILRWLALLDRVRDPSQLPLPSGETPDGQQLTLLTPLAGRTRLPDTKRLRDPDLPPPRLHRRGRPATGECQDCGAEFEMNPFGRPATRCAEHRRTTTPRQETA